MQIEREKKVKLEEPEVNIPAQKKEEKEVKEAKEKITGEKKLTRTNESLGLLIGSQGRNASANELKSKRSNLSKNKDYNSESLESSSSDS
jgi:hypothetical protein